MHGERVSRRGTLWAAKSKQREAGRDGVRTERVESAMHRLETSGPPVGLRVIYLVLV